MSNALPLAHRFRPGQPWLDTSGQPIWAHAGGVLYDAGRYWWYGMDFDGETLPPHTLSPKQDYTWMRNRGVSVYSSSDLYHWRPEGRSLAAVEDDPTSPLQPQNWVIRPKVVRSRSTGKYVLYGALTAPDWSCNTCVVATADVPAGPFTLHALVDPPHGAWDMGLYQDDDGSTWLITAHHATYLHRLSDDCLRIVSTTKLEGPDGESPALFKHDGTYYIILSLLWGWLPNPNSWWSAPSLQGPWTLGGEIAVGEQATNTFSTQVTFVLPVAGQAGAFIFMSDRFNATTMYDLADFRQATHVWLPIDIDAQNKRISVAWRETWDLSAFAT